MSNQNTTFRRNDIVLRFIFIFLPLALFFGSLTVIFYYKDVNTQRLTMEKGELYKVNSQEKTARTKFDHIITDLRFLVRQSELAAYLENQEEQSRKKLAAELLLFSRIKKIYDQIQFIDRQGLETIRIGNEESPAVMLDDEPADKSTQDYFRYAMGLPSTGVFISPFKTDGAGEGIGPGKQVVRFSMPVVDSANASHGVIVLSYAINYLVEDLQSASINSPGQTILVTPEGQYLNEVPQGKMPPGDAAGERLHHLPPEEWAAIRSAESGQFYTDEGLLTFDTFHPLPMPSSQKGPVVSVSAGNTYLWKTISFVPQEVLKKWPEKVLGRILLLYSVCLIIIAVSSFVLARASVRRRRAEKAMRENEEELRAINEAAANAIIAIDNNKNVLHWNPAAERLFQYTAQEVLDKPITSIISPPKHQSTFTKMSRRFKMPVDTGSMEAKTIELYGYKKDGTEFPVEVSFSAFKKGEQWHTVGIIRDISARRKMEKEVLRANKFESLGVLSSGIAHDFNNLLTAIIGNINLVSKLSGTSSDSLELLKNAEKAARRAKALTQQLLTFSKEGMPVRKTVAIDRLVRDSAEFALHGSSITSSFDIAADLLLVDIDAGQIGQVIQNVVTNGRQSIVGSGAIHIRCCNVDPAQVTALPDKVNGQFIEIAINDTGHGIPAREQGKIFEPYFTTKDHGSGLGLTIAASIIQRHDGFITFESAEDRGSTFRVYLPAAVDQRPEGKQQKRKGKGKNFKIMVIDNEEILLNIAGRMLVHLGHECVCARTAREALDIYKHLWKTGTPVDGVIIDLTLPGGMGGKETAAAIFDINSEARIIVSSGYSNDPVMVDFDEYGFCAAIAKPFDMDELAEVIEEVLE